MKKHFEITIKGNEKVILSAVQWFKGTHFICLFFIYLQSVLIYLFFFIYCPSFSCQLLHWLSKIFMFFCFDFVFFFYFIFFKYQSLKFTLSPYEDTSKQIYNLLFFLPFVCLFWSQCPVCCFGRTGDCWSFEKRRKVVKTWEMHWWNVREITFVKNSAVFF